MPEKVMSCQHSVKTICGTRPDAAADLLAVIAPGVIAIRAAGTVQGRIHLATTLTAFPPTFSGEKGRTTHIL